MSKIVKSREVHIVPPEQMGMAFVLFRGAVLDETIQGPIVPITDRGVEVALAEPDAMERGMGVLRIHFECSDEPHPAMRRIKSFLLLLDQQKWKPGPNWRDLVATHNEFLPILKAMAWCPVLVDKPFELNLFSKLVQHIPAELDPNLRQ
jgi:hypothetical protein